MTEITPLGPSHFSINADYTESVFLHYYQQIHHVLVMNPRTVLIVGVGDHLVSDFLKRKGLSVKTLDNDPFLQPDYLRDIRQSLTINEDFDVVLASEIFEHFRFSQFESALKNLKPVAGNFLVISLPYPTVRLFPPRPKYGKVVSCEGRIYTYLPQYFYTPVAKFYIFLKRIILYKFDVVRAWRSTFKPPEYPDDKADVHHWDLGCWRTRRSMVRRIIRKHFKILHEKVYINTNCVFFTLEKRSNETQLT